MRIAYVQYVCACIISNDRVSILSKIVCVWLCIGGNYNSHGKIWMPNPCLQLYIVQMQLTWNIWINTACISCWCDGDYNACCQRNKPCGTGRNCSNPTVFQKLPHAWSERPLEGAARWYVRTAAFSQEILVIRWGLFAVTVTVTRYYEYFLPRNNVMYIMW